MHEQNVFESHTAPSSSRIYTSGKTERLWRRNIQWVLTVKCEEFSVSNGVGRQWVDPATRWMGEITFAMFIPKVQDKRAGKIPQRQQ